jgi:ABC-type nitrate/sulfonate/bicarbonate transport system substrate-binding protein
MRQSLTSPKDKSPMHSQIPYRRTRNKRASLSVSFSIVIALLLSACGANNVAPTQAPPKTKSSVQLHWLHSVSFSPLYIAADKGYFADEHLDVNIMEGGFDAEKKFIDPIEQVVSGKADFGTADGTTILNARASGKPVVAIATIYQRHPLVLTSLDDKHITKPADLVGKTVHTSGSSTVLLQALLRSQGIDPAKVNIVERKDLTEGPLVKGEADVIDAWLITEIVTLKLKKINFNVILPSDYGIVVYPEVIFTTEETLLKKPEVVDHFLRATLHGIQTAVDDPQYSATLSQKYDKAHSAEEISLAMQQSLPLLLPAKSKPGAMTAEVWKDTYAILRDQKILTGTLDVEKAFTLTFLNNINGSSTK